MQSKLYLSCVPPTFLRCLFCVWLLFSTPSFAQDYDSITASRVSDCEYCLQPEILDLCRSLTVTCVEWLTCPNESETDEIANRAKQLFMDVNCENRIQNEMKSEPFCTSFWQQMFFDAADDSEDNKFCQIDLGSRLNITLRGMESAIVKVLRKKIRDRSLQCVDRLIEFEGDDENAIMNYFGVRTSRFAKKTTQTMRKIHGHENETYNPDDFPTYGQNTTPYKFWIEFSARKTNKLGRTKLVQKAISIAARQSKGRVLRNTVRTYSKNGGLVVSIMVADACKSVWC